jgi:hypothetical protein
MLRLARIVRYSSAIALGTALAAIAIAGSAATPAHASSDPAPLGCEPIECAAAYIGVSRSTLAADIVNETIRTGTLGTRVALNQLDAAMAQKLSAIAPTPSASLVASYQTVIANHDTIRDAVLDQAVSGLLGTSEG